MPPRVTAVVLFSLRTVVDNGNLLLGVGSALDVRFHPSPYSQRAEEAYRVPLTGEERKRIASLYRKAAALPGNAPTQLRPGEQTLDLEPGDGGAARHYRLDAKPAPVKRLAEELVRLSRRR